MRMQPTPRIAVYVCSRLLAHACLFTRLLVTPFLLTPSCSRTFLFTPSCSRLLVHTFLFTPSCSRLLVHTSGRRVDHAHVRHVAALHHAQQRCDAHSSVVTPLPLHASVCSQRLSFRSHLGVEHVLSHVAIHYRNLLDQPFGNFAHQRMEQLNPFELMRFHMPVVTVH